MRPFELLRQVVRCPSGAAALEAAVVLPVAISLMAGGVEFGRMFSAYGTASKSVRDAARYLARVPKDVSSGDSYICGWGLINARNLAIYGKLDPTNVDQPLLPNWSTNDVTLLNPVCGTPLIEPIIIDLHAAVPYSGFMFSAVRLPNSWTLNVKHQERHIGE